MVYSWHQRGRKGFIEKAPKVGLVLLILSLVGLVGFQAGLLAVEGNLRKLESPKTVAISEETGTDNAADQTPLPEDTTSSELQAVVDNFVKSKTTPYGVYIKHLDTKEEAGYNQHMGFITASLYKLVVGHEIYRMVDKGEINPEAATGAGLSTSVNKCLNIMITISDNPCGRALRTRVGTNKPLPQLADYGMKGTYLGKSYPTSTAYDLGQLYERIYEGSTLSEGSRKAYLDLLKAQKIVNRLPKGLPSGTEIAHKTGDLEGFYHDSGIVYSPKGAYVISVMSGPVNSNLSSHFGDFGKLSKEVYDYFQTSEFGEESNS